MSYIKLDEVTAEHLVGVWKVKQRHTNSTNVGEIFARCATVKFLETGSFSTVAQDGKLKKGKWEIIREKEMIYNPQVKFNLARKNFVNSIITNMMAEEENPSKLILYFDSGIELVLEKDLEKATYRRLKAA